jgi:hypothetical protein
MGNRVGVFGNYYFNNVEIGRQDADFGMLLSVEKGKMKGSFPTVEINGQVRKVLPIKIRGKLAYVLAKNNAAIQIISEK